VVITAAMVNVNAVRGMSLNDIAGFYWSEHDRRILAQQGTPCA
jgi:hypothetical protein